MGFAIDTNIQVFKGKYLPKSYRNFHRIDDHFQHNLCMCICCSYVFVYVCEPLRQIINNIKFTRSSEECMAKKMFGKSFCWIHIAMLRYAMLCCEVDAAGMSSMRDSIRISIRVFCIKVFFKLFIWYVENTTCVPRRSYSTNTLIHSLALVWG